MSWYHALHGRSRYVVLAIHAQRNMTLCHFMLILYWLNSAHNFLERTITYDHSVWKIGLLNFKFGPNFIALSKVRSFWSLIQTAPPPPVISVYFSRFLSTICCSSPLQYFFTLVDSLRINLHQYGRAVCSIHLTTGLHLAAANAGYNFTNHSPGCPEYQGDPFGSPGVFFTKYCITYLNSIAPGLILHLTSISYNYPSGSLWNGQTGRA